MASKGTGFGMEVGSEDGRSRTLDLLRIRPSDCDSGRSAFANFVNIERLKKAAPKLPKALVCAIKGCDHLVGCIPTYQTFDQP